MSFSQPSLFDVRSHPERLYFLTNRYNLLEFLSSGRIIPRSRIDKYYSDLLQHAAGHITLFVDSVPDECVAHVSTETPTAYPVVLEIQVVQSEADKLHRWDAGPGLLASRNPIPMSSVSSIAFRTDGEREEHLARSYSNVPDFVPLDVRPEMFVSPGPSVGTIIQLLAELDYPELDPLHEQVDRVAGVKLALSLVGAGTGSQHLSEQEVQNSLNASFLAASLGTFVSYQPADGWPALQVLGSLEDRLEVANSESPRFDDQLKTMRSVLRNDESLETAAAVLDDDCLAVLLVLLRPDPVRIWRSDTAISTETRCIAAAVAGWLVGFSRLEKPNGTDDSRFVDESASWTPDFVGEDLGVGD